MRLGLWCSLLVQTGCMLGSLGTTAEFVPTNPATVPLVRRQATDVTIVSTAPQRPFIEIGFVEGWSRATWADLDPRQDVLTQMRATAAQQGCHALLITGTNGIDRGPQGPGTIVSYHAACLVFTDPEGPPPPAPPPPPKSPQTNAAPVFFFRDAEGNIYRVVGEEARQAARHMGWTETSPAS
jgi:hypothetical protein